MKPKNPRPAHVENIHKYALGLSKEIETAPEIGEWLNEQLSLEIWKKAPRRLFHTPFLVDGWKAEILITYGGPLVKIEIDSRWNLATLYHSWGWSDHNGEMKEWSISEKATEILKDYIEEYCLDC